ncbi:MAG: polysaccharide biosynthesis tyrosine autokinase [Phycisphaerales bacterium]|nr:MAG: polysaccharide biosynthesis tyrosine autokinase [Phycisphaerales bacterium]
MTERPEQRGAASSVGGSGAIVESMPVGDGRLAARAPVDGGLLAAAAGVEGEPSAVVSVSALLRSKWQILGVFLLLSALALPVIWLFVMPTFAATATVRVTPVLTRLVFETPENESAVRGFFPSYINTQVSDLSNPKVLQRVLDRDEVKGTAWWRQEPRTLRTMLGSPPPSRLERLKADLRVKQQPNTELIDVQIICADPSDACVIVNAVVAEYIRYYEETRAEQRREALSVLKDELRGLDRKIAGIMDSVGTLSKQLGTDDPDIVRSQLAEQLGELQMERKMVERAYKTNVGDLKTRRSDESNEEGGADGAASREPNLRYGRDRTWVELNSKLRDAEHKLRVAQDRFGDSHPQIKEFRADVEHGERLLREREEQLGPGWPVVSEPGPRSTEEGSVFLNLDDETLARLVKRQERELGVLGEQIQELQREQEDKGELARDIAKLNEELTRSRALRDLVINQVQAREMEQQAPGRVSLAAKAVPPSKPFRDRRFLLSFMALGAAMMAGLALAYVRTMVNPTIHEAGDVQCAVHVPFLGRLPVVRSAGDLSVDCGPEMEEGIRMVRTALLERVRGTDRRTVLVTSSSCQAGKSTVAMLLGRSLAALGQRVLLVEADLRRPSLARRLSVEADVGLSMLLVGRADDNQAIHPTDVPGLDVIVAGRRPADSGWELLANGQLTASLARWKKSYDFVLLDSPPVLAVADARILAACADGVMMVLRSSHCRRADVVQAYADLSTTGTALLGTVLVGDESLSRYAYRRYYSYREGADVCESGEASA